MQMEWSDGKKRCCWANPKNERYIRYRDEEWGVPVHDDGKLFPFPYWRQWAVYFALAEAIHKQSHG